MTSSAQLPWPATWLQSNSICQRSELPLRAKSGWGHLLASSQRGRRPFPIAAENAISNIVSAGLRGHRHSDGHSEVFFIRCNTAVETALLETAVESFKIAVVSSKAPVVQSQCSSVAAVTSSVPVIPVATAAATTAAAAAAQQPSPHL